VVRLAWLPFDPAPLGDLPDGLRVEHVDPSRGGADTALGEVEFFVPPYDRPLDLAQLLPRMTSLSVVQTQTAGVDNVLPHLPAGVQLCNARGVHDASTAELAVALLLSALRGIPDFVRAQEVGRWAHGQRRALADHRVLVLGHGSIGEAVERRLEPFECEVVRVARSRRTDSRGQPVHGLDELDELLPQVDAVVVLVPLSDRTRGLVGRDFLSRLRDQAVLVNVARGAVVDTDALLAETSSGRLLAALDVTDPEPLPPEHPLWRSPGVLVSPHVGGATTAMQPRILRLLREQLRRFAAGDPLVNRVA
jgi:phosphoglycerate dehydrogenase-like enzyme